MTDPSSAGSTDGRQRRRALLPAVLLVMLGLGVGLVLGRAWVSDGEVQVDAAAPAPTVTVTAPRADGPLPIGPDGLPGPPESLDDLARLEPFSGKAKDRPLAIAGEGDGSGDGSGSGVGTGSGSGAGSGGGVDGGGSGEVDGGRLQPFTMRATLPPPTLLLGVDRQLTIRISNPNAVPITLDTVRIRVEQPSAAGCDPAWLEIDDYVRGGGPAIVVPARGARELQRPIVLVNLPTTNQNACQGASFPLSLSGSART